ncbi:MAG: 50S ribosomal protein L25 [Candidatus Atribacteria bacterium]|nr:50S ribosomal protein L25 [Candidatus Atribacteria bacterium]
MKRVEIKVEEREVSTKGRLKKYRKEGKIPGVVYGTTTDTFYVVTDGRDFLKIERQVGRSAIFDLSLNGKIYPSIIKEIQIDPIKRNIVHLDFESVDLEKPLYTSIPVVFVGEAKGVKKGGILDPSLHEIEVEGLIMDLPDKIEVDVSDLDIKDVIYVKDLKLGDKIKVYTDPDDVVVSVVTPVVEEVAAAPAQPVAEGEGAPTEAGTTPEVSKETKESKKEG